MLNITSGKCFGVSIHMCDKPTVYIGFTDSIFQIFKTFSYLGFSFSHGVTCSFEHLKRGEEGKSNLQ